MNNYELNVRSNGKTYREYNIGDDLFIGVNKDEEFEVVFKNNTSAPVQVRLSIDGTDILTGDQATSNATGEMWYCGARDTLVLKAWPESSSGGAKFIFSDSKKSVAAHTHGNMSGRGLIAAAVYTEKYVYFSTFNNGYNPYISPGILRSKSVPVNMDTIITCSSTTTQTDSLPAVGASEYTEQKLSKVAGLREPGLSQILYLNYDWWNNLKKQLKPTKQMQAFPGDDNFVGIDLKNTPRKGKTKKAKLEKLVQERFL